MNEDLQRYLEVARRATSTYEWVLTLVIYLFHTQCVMLRANGHYRACGKGMHATVIKYTLAVASRTSAVQTVQIMSHVYSLCLYSYQEMFQLNSPKKKKIVSSTRRNTCVTIRSIHTHSKTCRGFESACFSGPLSFKRSHREARATTEQLWNPPVMRTSDLTKSLQVPT